MSGRRIAILAHSTNPRGGVVHAMQLAEALCEAGEDAMLVAPDAAGRGFFRKTRCPTLTIPVTPACDLAVMVPRRISEVARFLAGPLAPRFDLYHSHDSITANALADLAERGDIDGFARTVHHLDQFADPRQAARQERGVRAAAVLACVSVLWQERLRGEYGCEPVRVGNGVDTGRFTSAASPDDLALRHRLGLDDAGPVILTLGGIEARKNTIATMRAASRLRARHPGLRLVIAGGASLLDHSLYREAFEAALAAEGSARMVVRAGVLADDEMPSLYRIADAFACPSLMEGFGLCVLEAMASGLPAIVSRMAPFTEHMGMDEVVWTDPDDVGAIARAMEAALDPATATRLRVRARIAATRFDWADVAARHAALYDALGSKVPAHA